jgi:hypothetical protein
MMKLTMMMIYFQMMSADADAALAVAVNQFEFERRHCCVPRCVQCIQLLVT